MHRDDYKAAPGSSSQPRVGSASVQAQSNGGLGTQPQQTASVNRDNQDAASDTSVTDADSDDESESDDPSGGKTGNDRYREPRARVKWTTLETDCLTQALMRTLCVPGPHRNQPYVTILALHGRKGYLDEKLKGRTVVQLKDKARHIATAYLLLKRRVPYWKRYLCPAEYVSVAPHACIMSPN